MPAGQVLLYGLQVVAHFRVLKAFEQNGFIRWKGPDCGEIGSMDPSPHLCVHVSTDYQFTGLMLFPCS